MQFPNIAPLQRLFGEVARRTSSAIHTPSYSATGAAAATRGSATAATNTGETTAEAAAVVNRARISNRAAAVKKFIGGAAIGGVIRTMAPQYTQRDESDHVPITEGKFAKAFDAHLLENIKLSQMPALFDMGDMDEELEVWELKTEGRSNPVLAQKDAQQTSLSRNVQQKSAAFRQLSMFSVDGKKKDVDNDLAHEEPEVPAGPTLAQQQARAMLAVKPTKSAIRSRSASPSAVRRHSGSGLSGTPSIRFNETNLATALETAKLEPPTAVKTSPQRAEHFLVPPVPKSPMSAQPVETFSSPQRSNRSSGFTESKASGIFLSTYMSDKEDGESSGEDSHVLHHEGGEFAESYIKASVEAMFAEHNYKSPFKSPPPPPPPSQPQSESTPDGNEETLENGGALQLEFEGEAGSEAQADEHADAYRSGNNESVDSHKPMPGSNNAILEGGNYFLQNAEDSSDEEEQKQKEPEIPPAPAVFSNVSSIKSRIQELNKGNSTGIFVAPVVTKSVATAPKKVSPPAKTDVPEVLSPPPPPPPLASFRNNAATRPVNQASVQSHSSQVGPPVPPAPKLDASSPAATKPAEKFSPTRSAPVSRFAANSFSSMVPMPVLSNAGATISTDEFLTETNKVLSTTMLKMNAFAHTNSLKLPASNPLISELVNTQFSRTANLSDLSVNGHGKLDAFEQLMMERKAIAEAMAKLQALENVSLERIKQAEHESLQRIQAEAVCSIKHVKDAEHRLHDKVHVHVDKVKKESQVLNDMRRDLYNRQVEASNLHQQRFEEVADMATSLAEQQLYIAAERRRIAERQFQLNLSLLDLNQVAASRSVPSSPQRSVVSALSPTSNVGRSEFKASESFREPPVLSLQVPASHAHMAQSKPALYQDFSHGRSPAETDPFAHGIHLQQHPVPVQQYDQHPAFYPSPQYPPPPPQQYYSPSNQQSSSSEKPSPPGSGNSVQGSHTGSVSFEKLPPNWHSPVSPLITRKSHHVSPTAEQPSAASRAHQQARRASLAAAAKTVHYGDMQQHFPSAAKATQDPNWRKPFR